MIMAAWIDAKMYCVISIILFIAYAEATNCKGCVQLDSFSFDKVTSKFPASLIKFDVAYPYGEKHEEFGKTSEMLQDVPDLLVAEIGVKDYGDKENTDLATRFKIGKDDFPVVIVLKSSTDGVEEFRFKGEFKADEIITFTRQHSKVYIGLPGCLQEFDEKAEKFVVAKNVEEKKKLLRETEDLWDAAKGVRSQKTAEVYVKTMRRLLEKEDFIQSEVKRLENLVKGKVSKEKAQELQQRLNIIKSFHAHSPVRDEL